MSRSIALLAYPRCQLLDVSGPWQVFASANELAGKPLYRLTLLGESPGPLATNSGMAFHADRSWHSLGVEETLDTLLVAGGSGVTEQCGNAALIDKLRELAPHVRRIGSVCTGAFLLAAAGLLDGHRATTHWRHCHRLAEAYPAISVDSDALYLESQGRYTSAGVTAGIDLALSLLEADHGAELAGRVARELVVFLHRPGGQSQFSEALRSQQRDVGPLRRLLDELHANPGADHCLEAMAARMAVSPRHLSRLFHRYLDTTPGAYLTRLRLEQARQTMLASPTPLPLERLARHWRLGGAEQLRRLFQRHYGVSPSVYRQRFRASPPNASAALSSPHPQEPRSCP
ncbi:Transcriptional regulator GlxA family, contains an amidase domain and an AraC-type DNA-binding HTH domain [Modicisalibacter muralis]|uniref:Transcriptional regulator GlxA family, contains an amidase domain and an AraC-type DNA-binding HTH domain n=1 Tax=Modicisalibacter muralis TaxID=119000 RepID=A0A1G9EXY6_9GAMM|nr:helix-turn-helix domain-containing protein [Halomonas muralis]SDK81009.1 Transcriptional regulator GlxA family, contains an amidase domain and an AraC-type DNA-binding HTH domain [Halomonas muralis]